jgi:hypothetical protein
MQRVTDTGRFQEALPYASGTSTRTGPTLDMQLWAHLLTEIHVHSVGATETITAKLYQGNASDMSDEAEVPQATLVWTAATTPLQIIDHSSITKRYARLKITKSPGSNASAESAVHLRYEPKLAVPENNTAGVAATARTLGESGTVATPDPSY